MIYGNICNSLNSLSRCAYIKLFTRALQEPIVCSPDFRKYCPKRGEFLDFADSGSLYVLFINVCQKASLYSYIVTLKA